MANRVKNQVAQTTILSADWENEFNNVYTGTIDRTAGRWGSNDDIAVTFGSSQDAGFHWNTTQTNDCLVLALSGSNTLLIVEDGDYATDFALANRTHPAIILHSSNAGNPNEYIEVFCEGANGVLNVGSAAGTGGYEVRIAGQVVFSVAFLGGVNNVIEISDRSIGANVAGPSLRIGRNTNATPSAGTIMLTDRAGVASFLWVDAAGKLRINSAAPTTAASDTVGTIVGTQS